MRSPGSPDCHRMVFSRRPSCRLRHEVATAGPRSSSTDSTPARRSAAAAASPAGPAPTITTGGTADMTIPPISAQCQRP